MIFDAVSRWLAAKPHRVTIINLTMLTAVLALSESAALFKLIGGSAILLAALYFFQRGILLTARRWAETDLYKLLVLWLPGLLAMALAYLGLQLATQPDASALNHGVGVVLFGFQLAMLALAGADLKSDLRIQTSGRG